MYLTDGLACHKKEDLNKEIIDKYITEDLLSKILKASPLTSQGKELRLAIRISYLSGLRLEETLTLKVDQIKETGAKLVATACSNCKVQLAHLIEYYELDVQWVGVHDLVGNALVL